MTVAPLFSRRHVGGWLVLAPELPGFGGAYPDLAAHLLERVDLGRPAVCVCASSAELKKAGRFAEELEGLLGAECPVHLLGGTAGLPAETAMAVLCGGDVAAWVEALSAESPTSRSLEALAEEGLVLAAGPAAGASGAWALLPSQADPARAAGWLTEAIVLPGANDPGEEASLRERLSGLTRLYAVALPPGSILALGPEGKVELWGSVRPTILLGGGWRSA